MGRVSCLFTLLLSYIDCTLSRLPTSKCLKSRQMLWLAAALPHEYFPTCSISLKKFCTTFKNFLVAKNFLFYFRRGCMWKLECERMPNLMAAQPNIGGALCSTSQFGWRPLFECHAVILPIKENATLGDGQASCKVWLTSVEWRQCSNDAKTQNPFKFAGVPQTPEPISAISVLKFTTLWGHVEEVLLSNKFFLIVDKCHSCEDIVRRSYAMVRRWRYFSSCICSTFQTCILNLH